MTDADESALQDVVRKAREGSETAFRALVLRVYDRVQRWALGFAGCPDLGDEITQRTLIRLHRHLGTYDADRPFESWLYGVTRNAAFSVLEEEKRHGARSGETTEQLPAPDHDPIERLNAGPMSELARVLFEELPARQREAFDLADLQGYAPSEVAEMMELAPSTVRVHLHRARARMRSEMLKRHPELREGSDHEV